MVQSPSGGDRRWACRRARRAAVAVLVVLAAATACTGETEEGASTMIGIADPSMIVPVAFDEVTTDQCLGSTSPVDGKVPTVGCDEPGAIPVVALTILGDGAPVDLPAVTVIAGYAAAACQDALGASSASADGEAVPGGIQVAVADEAGWTGPGTAVVCAVLESG